MYSILIVEDAKEISDQLSQILRNEHFYCEVAGTMAQAIGRLENEDADFDLALVDLMLPDGHGYSVFHAAQDRGVPVIFLTASDDEYTTAGALDMGAADFVPKPYRRRELLSRINRALRESGRMSAELTYGTLKVDTEKGVVFKNGQELYLSRLEYRLLLLFMNRPGKIFTRDNLIEDIYNVTREYITDNTLTKHIQRLREKIEDDPQEPTCIRTVRGIGYKLGD